MTDRQADLERVAREWLVKTGQVFWNGQDAVPSENDVAELVTLLAAQRAEGLDKYAGERLNEIDTLKAEVAKWKAEAQWATSEVANLMRYRAPNHVLAEDLDWQRAQRILDGKL